MTQSANEIMTIQIGSCGNYIGTAFWNTLLGEHWLDNNCSFINKADDMNERYARLDKINSYFYENERGILAYGYIRQHIENVYKNLYIPYDIKILCKYFIGAFNASKFAPRCILIDTDPTLMDTIKSSRIGNIFNKNNFIIGTGGTKNNWAKGHCTLGFDIIDVIMENIRNESETCDCLQGFELIHSIGGGTGSGLSSLIMEKLKDEYPNRINCSFTIYPSPKISDVVVEAYNAILSIDKLIDFGDDTFIIDNEALFNITHNVLKQKEAKYADLNWLSSLIMSGTTASFRISSEQPLNTDLRRFGINMVSFPRLHFFLLAHAPLFVSGQAKRVKLSIQEITDQMWSSSNFYSNIKAEDGKYLSVTCIYRGKNISIQEVDDEIPKDVCWRLADDFVTWIPNNIKSCLIGIGHPDTPLSGTFIANTTGIKGVFQRISKQFEKLYKRKAFLHWYKGEGMDEMEFEEAHKNVSDLIIEYQDKQDAVVDLENDWEYDEDEEYDDSEYEDEYDEDNDF